ncbi:CURVATURE THYLAKOID 1A, chloroplastic [Olea europaea subsp. europaea]|uniref:CURVATURE THYLAKOID 1A, chloroplastic n=1 Tax=Olea europaea subsp. europaea TaxID=158383 RepID=A0A8S0PAW4_OLEEU|nr:CURVATURE THYLAKOID 1A, chloroplastic [Olea europaea subsp. europaea]
MRIENHPIKNLQISTCHATKSYGYCIRERQKSLWITIIYKENLCTKWDFCIKRDRKGEAKQKREEFRWSLAVKWQRQLPLPWRRQPSRYIVSPPKPPSTAPPCRVCLPVSLLQLSPLPSGQFQRNKDPDDVDQDPVHTDPPPKSLSDSSGNSGDGWSFGGRSQRSSASRAVKELPASLESGASATQESRRSSCLLVKASSSDETSAVDANELLTDLKEKWDAVENKSTVLLYGVGAILATWLASIIVGAVNSVPLLPKIMELVGLGYTGWFVYRYLLFKSSRKELAEDIEVLKKKIAGTE